MAVQTDLCRITIMTPRHWAEVVLPTDVALVDLLPSVVRHVGDDDLAGDDVALQRLGDDPLEKDRTLRELTVLDGETLYLRPASATMPPVDFDDLIDGVATGVRQRSDRWSARLARRSLLTLSVLPAALALVACLLPGPVGLRAATAGAVAVLLVAAAGALARAGGDATTALVLGCAAYPFAVLAAAVFVGGATGPPTPTSSTVLASCGVLLATALALVGLTGRHGPVHVPVAGAAGVGLAVAVLDRVTGWERGPAAAVLLALVCLLSAFLPAFAYRCAGIAPPLLPTGADDLDETSTPVPGEELIARAGRADAYLTGLTATSSLLLVVGVLASLPARAWPAVALVVVVALLSTVRVRVMGSGAQRAALLTVPVVALAGLVGQWLLAADDVARAVATLVLVLLVGATVAAARLLPGRRLSPYWGRGTDLLESVLALCVLPLAVWATGLLAVVRGLGG